MKKWHRKFYFNRTCGTFYVLPHIDIEYNKYGHFKWRFNIGWLLWYVYFNGEPEEIFIDNIQNTVWQKLVCCMKKGHFSNNK